MPVPFILLRVVFKFKSVHFLKPIFNQSGLSIVGVLAAFSVSIFIMMAGVEIITSAKQVEVGFQQQSDLEVAHQVNIQRAKNLTQVKAAVLRGVPTANVPIYDRCLAGRPRATDNCATLFADRGLATSVDVANPWDAPAAVPSSAVAAGTSTELLAAGDQSATLPGNKLISSSVRFQMLCDNARGCTRVRVRVSTRLTSPGRTNAEPGFIEPSAKSNYRVSSFEISGAALANPEQISFACTGSAAILNMVTGVNLLTREANCEPSTATRSCTVTPGNPMTLFGAYASCLDVGNTPSPTGFANVSIVPSLTASRSIDSFTPPPPGFGTTTTTTTGGTTTTTTGGTTTTTTTGGTTTTTLSTCYEYDRGTNFGFACDNYIQGGFTSMASCDADRLAYLATPPFFACKTSHTTACTVGCTAVSTTTTTTLPACLPNGATYLGVGYCTAAGMDPPLPDSACCSGQSRRFCNVITDPYEFRCVGPVGTTTTTLPSGGCTYTPAAYQGPACDNISEPGAFPDLASCNAHRSAWIAGAPPGTEACVISLTSPCYGCGPAATTTTTLPVAGSCSGFYQGPCCRVVNYSGTVTAHLQDSNCTLSIARDYFGGDTAAGRNPLSWTSVTSDLAANNCCQPPASPGPLPPTCLSSGSPTSSFVSPTQARIQCCSNATTAPCTRADPGDPWECTCL